MGNSNYGFADGTSGVSIGDGGGDMYDGGNHLQLKVDGAWSSNLPYTQSTSFTPVPGHTAALYYTHKRLSPTVFVAEFTSLSSSIGGLKTSGNVGADGHGSQKTFALAPRNGYRAVAKQIYGAGDPSINHLIVARTNELKWNDISGSTSDRFVCQAEVTSAYIHTYISIHW